MPVRMVIAACAGMGAATCCHPLDVIRVHMQLDSEGGGARQYKGTVDAGKQIFQRSGLSKGLYAGLTAAYLRQWTYGSCRMGLYTYFLDKYKEDNAGVTPDLKIKLLYGATSGAIGAFVGNPAELALVRMGADNKKPVADRRGYTNVFNCLYRVAKEEGVAGMWKGCIPTVGRAFLMGGCLMGVTSESKEQLLKTGYFAPDPTAVPLVFVSALISSVCANIVTMPLDVVKSRLQNMKGGEYTGMFDCARKSVVESGLKVLWSGFTPAFIKLAPNTVISILLLEKLNVLITGKAGL